MYELAMRLSDLPRRVFGRVKRELRALGSEPETAVPTVAEPVAVSPTANETLNESVSSLKRELSMQLSFLAHDLAEHGKSVNAAFEQRLQRLEAAIEAISSNLNQLGSETGNRITHLDTGLHSRLNEIGNAAFEAGNRLSHLDSALNGRLNDAFNIEFPRVQEQLHEIASLIAGAAASPAAARAAAPKAAPPPNAVEPFDAILARARRDFPKVFDLWKERLDATEREMRVTKAGNAAHAADPYSKLFRLFVERHAGGAILDVGCGPYGKPYYLSSFPDDCIAGIEPLLFSPSVGASVVRGISEYLPWPNGAFDAVISATALDHSLSLERSLDEMTRVLTPSGRLLLWLGSQPGAKPFTPESPDFSPADRYHLFHFDIAWFEPALDARFHILDRIKLDRIQYSHVFYCLTLRPR